MSDAKAKMQETESQEVLDRRHQEHKGPSGGNMGAGQSGKENLGTEKPTEDTRWGSHKPNQNSHNGDNGEERNEDDNGNDQKQ
ncbi:MAG: hypothetical protein QM758_28705 [Armatimonas sp.]